MLSANIVFLVLYFGKGLLFFCSMTITINNKPVDFPNCWNDLDAKTLLRMMRIIGSLQPNDTLVAFKMQLASEILNLPRNFWKKLRKDCDKEADADAVFTAEVTALISVCRFFLDDKFPFQAKLSLTKQHFYKMNGMYGPLKELKNISFGEWLMIDRLFLAVLSTEDEKHLNQLIGVIYRPSKPKTRHNKQTHYDGDRRQSILIHQTVLDEYVQKVAKWKPELKLAIFIFVASCRKKIIERYPVLFKKKAAGESTANEATDYAELVLRLAGTKFGDDEETFNKPVHTILKYLEMLEKDRVKQ